MNIISITSPNMTEHPLAQTSPNPAEKAEAKEKDSANTDFKIQEVRLRNVLEKQIKNYDIHVKKVQKELLTFLKTHFPLHSSFALPPIDENYKPPFEMCGVFTQFAPSSELRDMLEELFVDLLKKGVFKDVKTIKDQDEAFIYTVAKQINDFVMLLATKDNFLHYEAYIKNPQLYTAAKGKGLSLTPLSSEALKVETIYAEGKQLFGHLLQRIEWAIHVQKDAKLKPEITFCLKVIAAEDYWLVRTMFLDFKYEKLFETTMKTIGKNNQRKIVRFSQYKKENFAWPHAEHMLKEIENAGFQYNPDVEARDRCRCEKCDMEISGGLLQLTPWKFHIFSSHTPGFEKLAKQGKAQATRKAKPNIIKLIMPRFCSALASN